jgi:hypothetical protein
LFFNSTYPVNYIAREIFWAEIYRESLFLGPRYIGDDSFFRADRSLGAKQEGLTVVHSLNKLIVSCKEAVKFRHRMDNRSEVQEIAFSFE